jgi:hypothetical protein
VNSPNLDPFAAVMLHVGPSCVRLWRRGSRNSENNTERRNTEPENSESPGWPANRPTGRGGPRPSVPTGSPAERVGAEGRAPDGGGGGGESPLATPPGGQLLRNRHPGSEVLGHPAPVRFNRRRLLPLMPAHDARGVVLQIVAMLRAPCSGTHGRIVKE